MIKFFCVSSVGFCFVACVSGTQPPPSLKDPSHPHATEAPWAAPSAQSSNPTIQSKTSAAPALYVCPMHADVRSNKPGKCPKCGMTLEQKFEHEH